MNKKGRDTAHDEAVPTEVHGRVVPLSEPRPCEIGSEVGERCPLPAYWEVNGVAMCDEDIRMLASMNSDNEELVCTALAAIRQEEEVIR